MCMLAINRQEKKVDIMEALIHHLALVLGVEQRIFV